MSLRVFLVAAIVLASNASSAGAASKVTDKKLPLLPTRVSQEVPILLPQDPLAAGGPGLGVEYLTSPLYDFAKEDPNKAFWCCLSLSVVGTVTLIILKEFDRKRNPADRTLF